jgi:hypothetical protein
MFTLLAVLVVIAAVFLMVAIAVHCYDGTLCGYWVGASCIDTVVKVAGFAVAALLSAASDS